MPSARVNSVPSEKFTPAPTAAALGHPLQFCRQSREKRWDIFEPDGRYVGRLVAPRAFGLPCSEGDYVWGVERDGDNVPTIVKMRIEQAPRP